MPNQNNRILVPEAREELDELKGRVMAKQGQDNKYEVADELGVPMKKGYNGDMKAKDAGKVGGNIGGEMVREMIRMAEQNLNKKQ